MQACQQRLIAAEAQRDSIRVAPCQKPFFKTFHGPCNGTAGTNRIHAQFVTERRGAKHGIGVGYTDERSQGKDAFVLHASLRFRTPVHRHENLFATNGTVGTMRIFHEMLLVERFATHLL